MVLFILRKATKKTDSFASAKKTYLGWDFLVLNTVLSFLFKLALNLTGKTIALVGLDTVAGSMSFGLGMEAHGGSSDVILAQSVEVSA